MTRFFNRVFLVFGILLLAEGVADNVEFWSWHIFFGAILIVVGIDGIKNES